MKSPVVLRVVVWVFLGWLMVGCVPEAPRTPLIQAVQKDNLKLVEQHIAARSDLNGKDKNGWTALHFAAMRGNLAIAKALTAAGADTTRTGPGGRTALDMAREQGKAAVAEFLQGIPAKSARGRGLVDGGLGVSEVLDAH